MPARKRKGKKTEDATKDPFLSWLAVPAHKSTLTHQMLQKQDVEETADVGMETRYQENPCRVQSRPEQKCTKAAAKVVSETQLMAVQAKIKAFESAVHLALRRPMINVTRHGKTLKRKGRSAAFLDLRRIMRRHKWLHFGSKNAQKQRCKYPYCGCEHCEAPGSNRLSEGPQKQKQKRRCYDCGGSRANHPDALVHNLYHTAPCRTAVMIPRSVADKAKFAVDEAQKVFQGKEVKLRQLQNEVFAKLKQAPTCWKKACNSDDILKISDMQSALKTFY